MNVYCLKSIVLGIKLDKSNIHNPDGSIYNIIGEGLPGDPLKMIYTPPVGDDTIGHWEPKDKSIKVEKSSENNCFYDALYAQLSDKQKGKLEIKKVEDLRPLVANAIDNNPSLADKFLKEAQYLNVLDERLMMVGGPLYLTIMIFFKNIIPGCWLNNLHICRISGTREGYHIIRQRAQQSWVGGPLLSYFFLNEIQ